LEEMHADDPLRVICVLFVIYGVMSVDTQSAGKSARYHGALSTCRPRSTCISCVHLARLPCVPSCTAVMRVRVIDNGPIALESFVLAPKPNSGVLHALNAT